jgi:hypothetical protein
MPAAPAAIVHDDRLAEPGGDLLGEQTADDVVGAAGRVGRDQRDHPGRPLWRLRAGRDDGA